MSSEVELPAGMVAIDWSLPIIVSRLGGDMARGRIVSGPDQDGHRRVDFQNGLYRGMQWFDEFGMPVGATGNRVRQASATPPPARPKDSVIEREARERVVCDQIVDLMRKGLTLTAERTLLAFADAERAGDPTRAAAMREAAAKVADSWLHDDSARIAFAMGMDETMLEVARRTAAGLAAAIRALPLPAADPSYVRVPREPTEAMVHDGWMAMRSGDGADAADCWDAMIAAAPTNGDA